MLIDCGTLADIELLPANELQPDTWLSGLGADGTLAGMELLLPTELLDSESGTLADIELLPANELQPDTWLSGADGTLAGMELLLPTELLDTESGTLADIELPGQMQVELWKNFGASPEIQ